MNDNNGPWCRGYYLHKNNADARVAELEIEFPPKVKPEGASFSWIMDSGHHFWVDGPYELLDWTE